MGNGARKLKNVRYNNETSAKPTNDADQFLKEISEPLSYEQALVKLPRAVFYLNQYKTIDTTDVRRLLVFLRQFSGPLKTTVADQRVRWVEQLLNENVLQICLNFWRITFTPRIFSKKFEEEMRNFRNIIGIIWNSTEISRPCCINVCDNNGVKVLLDTINADCLNDAKLKLQDMSNINRVYVSHSSGAILKNILYSYCDAKRLFRQADGIKICQKLMTFSSDIIKSTAAILLAYGVNDDEFHLITSADNLLLYIIRLLNECAKDSGHHSIFSSLDMLDALIKLSANDENKLRLVKLGVLDPLTKFINEPLNDAELNLTIKCIWILAFSDGNKKIINVNSDIMQKLKAYQNHSDPEIVKKAKGALWTLNTVPPLTTDNMINGVSDMDEDSDELEEEKERDSSATTDKNLMEEIDGIVAPGPIGPPPNVANSSSSVIQKLDAKIFKRSRRKKEENSKNEISQKPQQSRGENSGNKKKNSKLPTSPRRGVNGQFNNDVQKSANLNKDKSHIMISYQWNYKPLILRINDALKNAGYKVWVDVEQMSGSTLEAMADAIENAWLVLICMSDSYKQSPSCRTEAEYTYKMRKDFIPVQLENRYKPTGWLGILVGTKLYFNMTSDNNIVSNMPSLLREISTRSSSMQYSPPLVKVENFLGSQAVTSQGQIDSHETARKLDKWSESDVQKWLKDNELDDLLLTFAKFNGPLLLGLRKIYFKAPLIYYSTLKNDLNVHDLHILIKFTNALESL